MKEDFPPLKARCCVCEKVRICIVRDDDLNGVVCRDCLAHVLNANAVMLSDLRQCGIIR